MIRLLIIDDELDILEILVEYLSLLNLNLELQTASTVEEAIQKIENADIIISDINMPQRDKLDSLLKNCRKPIARITGHDDIVGELVIGKPFTFESLKKPVELLIKLFHEKNL